MFKVGGWLGAAKAKTGQTKSLTALEELSQIEDAMASVAYIMADDVNTAEELLSKGSSPFHQLGKGVVIFIRATLGFEQEVMREASRTLSDAENLAYEYQRRAQRNPNAYQSLIYPVGTEYAVCLAEAQLMSAVVGVLNESLTEAIKGFYKLRKAYLTLESVMEAEKKFLRERSSSSLTSVGSGASSRPGSGEGKDGPGAVAKVPIPEETSAAASKTNLNKDDKKTSQEGVDDDDDFDFVDAEESRTNVETPVEYTGHLNIPAEKSKTIQLDSSQRRIEVKSSSAPNLPSDTQPKTSVPGSIQDFTRLSLTDAGRPEEDISPFIEHPADVFIVSATTFIFGILLLLISLVPPAFASLLKIVGFKGDKDRGLQLLWQATKYHNIHGAMAGQVLFGYYNGISGFCDILPSTGEGSMPKERCQALLTEMRGRYPKSHLWLLEEARSFAADGEIEKAVDFLANCSESPLQQLEALSWFERSIHTMTLHDYAAASLGFQKCVLLNNWSHGLYYYICGASHLELYRRHKSTDAAEAAAQAAKAVEFFKLVTPNIGRKRFMARQLPFDIFVNRKIQKWEARAKEWKCDLVDAIGVSPLEEMIYFWNGYKRMRTEHLETSLQNLAWSEGAANPHWAKEGLDERSILALLRAVVLRNMGRAAESRELLQRDIISHDRALFKGSLKDSWTAPCARYEMAASVWYEIEEQGEPDEQRERLEQCRTWLEEVSGWEGYDLDARMGMKITAGKTTLRRFGVEC